MVRACCACLPAIGVRLGALWHHGPVGSGLRHDQYLEVIANTLRKHCGILAYTGQYLNKDSYSNKSTDLLIVFPGDLHRRPIALDYRCVCPFLVTYRGKAMKDVESVLLPIAKDKEGKHSQHCDGAGRDFIAIPGTTLGSTGHRPFLDIIDAAWSRAIPHPAQP